MQLAIGAIGAIGKAFGLGGAAAGTAGGVGSTALGILSGLGGAVSALASISAGNAAASQSRVQAIQTEVEAGQAQVESTQQQTRIKRELLAVLGDNSVAAANAGIDISAGIAQDANRRAQTTAAQELTISRNDQDTQAAMYRVRAAGLRQRARSEQQAGLLGAAGALINTGIDISRRGSYGKPASA